MAGSGVTLYSTTSAGNKAVIGTIDWREDTYMPSQINDNVGQIMADMRAMVNAIGTGWIEIGDGDGTYTATYVSATSFRFDGVNVASYYRAGMRVRVVAPTPGTLSGTITSSTFSTHTTLVVAWDSGSLSNEAITSVSLGIGSGGGSGAAASYRNILGRNGGFEVWQRTAGGTIVDMVVPASTGMYTADGWYFICGASQSHQIGPRVGQTAGSRWSCAIARTDGQTGVASPQIEFPLDTDEIVPARGQVVTLSLTLTAGAGFSPAGRNVNIVLYTGTGAPAKRAVGVYTGEATPISVTQAITTTATRYTFTSSVALGASVTQASVLLNWTPVGTASGDNFGIDDVQLEIGSAATPFERRPFEQELSACRRHYWKTFQYSVAPAQNTGNATGIHVAQTVAALAAQEAATLIFPTPMRIVPTITTFNPAAANNQARNLHVSADCTGMNVASISDYSIARLLFYAATGSAAGNINTFDYTADAGI